MNYELSNENIKIVVCDKGAELISLYSVTNNREYMWCRDPEFWNKCSPVLFPQIGRSYNDIALIDGKEYKIPKHGFARDNVFNLEYKSDNELALSFEYNEDTLKVYPYKFKLVIIYSIENNKLSVKYKVINLDNKDISFLIGGHPAFALENREESYVYLNKDEIISEVVDLKTGCLANETVKYSLDNGYLKLEDKLFEKDAIILEKQSINEVIICDRNKNKLLSINFDCELFGIWIPAPHAPFISIEPWYGRCDRNGFYDEFSKKEYANTLKENEIFEKVYTVTIY